MNMNTATYLAIACVIVPAIALGVKRMRERSQELLASFRVRRVLSRHGNVHRQRSGLVQELQNIDDDTFQRMFRMPKRTFFELETRVAPIIRAEKKWSPQSERMAIVSSGSPVATILLLAATIRLNHTFHRMCSVHT
jgi:hypothetical protein